MKKNWDSTLVYSMKQLSTTNNKDLIDYCYYFRGISFKQKKLLNEAKKELNTISNNFLFYYKVRLSLGEILLDQNEFKNAISYFQEIEKLPEDVDFGFKRSTVLHNLGISYLHLNQFDKAETYLLKSSELQLLNKDTIDLIGSYADIANLYYVQYKDKQAIPYFEKAYRLSKTISDFELKRKAALNMAVVEENRKNFLAALTYRKEYEQWKDSLNDQNKVWEIAQFEKKHAISQKQKEISLLEIENKLKVAEMNGLFYSSILLSLLLGVGIYFYEQKVKSNKIILAQKTELNKLNTTKDKLFSVVSHDLRSAVNALKVSNTKLSENLETKNIENLEKLLQNNSAIANGTYNLLDNLLHWASLQTNQSFFNKESMRLFFIIEQIAYNYKPLMFDKNIHFENKVSKNDWVYADQESLKIILRNLLDNAIKFSNQNGLITLYTLNRDEAYCDLVIEDNGLGMSETKRQELLKETMLLSKKKNEDVIGTGLGLQLCKSMIKKNEGRFMIESKEGKGTKIIVSLHKNQKNG
ncbi:tetratricopeptide repeat-containing sensor histidine kinase [Flavivirga aquimarina]|uniref:histidine kinase n=1 Tax=Flavivirga aquimarina TaxID=2027862 RepID=A0ABT8W9Y6_9FLAO|nr:tetratricopeptide repeat-containing sensor histidine kinase [Flavivirga aquimarina]MDO5969864.1 tetratricopeptide repeat-containing sensor histidine kinase [Flavivirga aquimarina]